MTTSEMPSIPPSFSSSPKANTPTRVATTGSEMDKIEALPAATLDRPYVYNMYGMMVLVAAMPIESATLLGVCSNVPSAGRSENGTMAIAANRNV